jgi:hypothetical protein
MIEQLSMAFTVLDVFSKQLPGQGGLNLPELENFSLTLCIQGRKQGPPALGEISKNAALPGENRPILRLQ